MVDSESNEEHFLYIKDFNKLMGSDGKHRTYYCKNCVQPFSSEERLKCHLNRVCFTVVGTIRALPNKDEKWIKYEYDKMMYNEKLCTFVCQADFECFCVKEYKEHDDEEHKDNNNDTNTTSSSNEIPPHLQKKKNRKKK